MMIKKFRVSLVIEVDLMDNIIPKADLIEGVKDNFDPADTQMCLDNGFEYRVIDSLVDLMEEI